MTLEELSIRLTPDPLKAWYAVSSEKEPDTFTRAIQRYQGTKYSHALVIYYSLDFQNYVIGNARGKASQLDTLEQFYGIGDEIDFIFEHHMDASLRMNFIRKIIELDGIDYSEKQILQIGLESIFGIRPDDNGIDGIICSEYASRIGVAGGLPCVSSIVNKPLDIISPKHCMAAWKHFAFSMSTFREI